MKSLGLLLVATGLLLAFAPTNVVAQTGSTSFDLETHADGSNYYFTLQGQTDKNPTLTVPANTAITVTIHNTGGASASTHNFCDSYDNKCTADFVSADGDKQTLTFTSGSSDGTYWCAPHKSLGMMGNFHIAGTTTSSSTPASSTKASPGFELVALGVAVVGAVLLLRRK